MAKLTARYSVQGLNCNAKSEKSFSNLAPGSAWCHSPRALVAWANLPEGAGQWGPSRVFEVPPGGCCALLVTLGRELSKGMQDFH